MKRAMPKGHKAAMPEMPKGHKHMMPNGTMMVGDMPMKPMPKEMPKKKGKR